MINSIVGAGAIVSGASSRYGSGSDQKMRLRLRPKDAAPAPQHWPIQVWRLRTPESVRYSNFPSDIQKWAIIIVDQLKH
jgi:hypothetical protein